MRKQTLPLVSAAFFCLLTFAAADAAAEKTKSKRAVEKITIEQFEQLMEEENAVVLDVRSAEEFAAGHVPGAVNIPINEDDFDDRLASLEKDKTYLVHCAKGVRSARATNKMRSFESVFDFSGGFEAWKAAGKPVEKVSPREEGE